MDRSRASNGQQEIKATYELYGSGDLQPRRLLHNRRFDFAMVASWTASSSSLNGQNAGSSLEFLAPVCRLQQPATCA